jgi:hypothetical protein
MRAPDTLIAKMLGTPRCDLVLRVIALRERIIDHVPG